MDAVKEDMWLVGVGGFGGGTRLAVATRGGNSSETWISYLNIPVVELMDWILTPSILDE